LDFTASGEWEGDNRVGDGPEVVEEREEKNAPSSGENSYELV
jgi:hypothetical protein